MPLPTGTRLFFAKVLRGHPCTASPTVTVPAKGTASVTVTITANAALVDRGLYGGYITFTPQGEGAPVQVVYAGFKGDYQSTQVLTPTANGFPWLASLAGTTYTNQPGGATFTMADTNNHLHTPENLELVQRNLFAWLTCLVDLAPFQHHLSDRAFQFTGSEIQKLGFDFDGGFPHGR